MWCLRCFFSFFLSGSGAGSCSTSIFLLYCSVAFNEENDATDECDDNDSDLDPVPEDEEEEEEEEYGTLIIGLLLFDALSFFSSSFSFFFVFPRKERSCASCASSSFPLLSLLSILTNISFFLLFFVFKCC